MDPQPVILADLRETVLKHTNAVVTAKDESPSTPEAMGPLAICSLLCAAMHVQIRCTEEILTELRSSREEGSVGLGLVAGKQQAIKDS